MADSYLPIPPTLKAEDWHAYDRPVSLHEVFQGLIAIERKLDILIKALADEEDEPTGTLEDNIPVTKPLDTL